MSGCDQGMCPNWSGDGNVCPCAVFGLERPSDAESTAVFDDGIDELGHQWALPSGPILSMISMPEVCLHCLIQSNDLGALQVCDRTLERIAE